jgi:multicomponent Na+:H+ antiporter subunit D
MPTEATTAGQAVQWALAVVVFAPLMGALLALLLPRAWEFGVAMVSSLAVPLALVPVTGTVLREGTVVVALGGFVPPLGIVWRADPLSVTMLWLTAVVMLAAALHARATFPAAGAPARAAEDAADPGRRFWPLWLLLLTGIVAAFLTADLFHAYVTLELVTLAAVALVAMGGTAAALTAAMRYLLLGLLASLFYLLGVALVYGQTGTLDVYLAMASLEDGPLAVTALAAMLVGLLLKSAIVPLHVWLPSAHGNAPGPVSAVLSALVVKVSLVLMLRIWFWTFASVHTPSAALVLGLLGAAAVVYGSVEALRQGRFKLVVAYSTVAQLGYVMLVFPLATAGAFQAVTYHLLAHGVAKASMFLVAANVMQALGSDRLRRMLGLGWRLPIDLLAFSLAGVSIMGLPFSGGFVAKWSLLESVYRQQAWGWMAIVALGSLLAAGYVFRVGAVTMAKHPRAEGVAVRPPPRAASLVALGLAVLSVALGFVAAPLLAWLVPGLPPGMSP